jgi:uncharacterized protein GlcG (DUF336 family)/NAD-dependent dihydropyrimidine dehydrogenase PreA subunit
MTYVIAQPCIEEKNASCVEVCPVACIHTTPDSPQYYIDPDICIECEQCEIVCPVNAIYLDYKLPEEWHGFIEVNAAFFRRNKAAAGPVPMDKAFEMVEAAHTYAAQVGIKVTAVLVDSACFPIAVARMDGAESRTAELAFNKAYTAANFQVATQELRAESRRPWFRSLVIKHHGHIMAAGGGMPIIDGITLVGAIGVAGGNEEQDLLCCRAGLSVLESPGH